MSDKKAIKRMLDDLLVEIEIETITGKRADLITSFKAQFDRGSYLSTKQQEILSDIYARFMGI